MTKRRLVLKLGTHTVLDTDQQAHPLAADRLDRISEICARHMDAVELAIVSSGAVGLGRNVLGLKSALTLAQKQACAAVGQNLLMEAYRKRFELHGRHTAQILLSASDFSNRNHYLNIRETIETLLKLGVVPIINENDTVSTDELEEERTSKSRSFGDNDKLSALVASELGADLLLLLTDVDGIYDQNPKKVSSAKIVSEITVAADYANVQAKGQSAYGRGGMSSKLEAARIASIAGLRTLVVNGTDPEQVEKAFAWFVSQKGPRPGTLIHPRTEIKRKKRWIGFSSGFAGVVVVNAGARQALLQKQASLLPVGVLSVQGKFEAKQVVSVRDEAGVEIGRGVVELSSLEVSRVIGKKSEAIRAILDRHDTDVVIHRDNIVVFESQS